MDEQRKDMESIGQAAARLLGRMDERAKKASGGFERPEKFRSGGVRRVPANENREKPVEQRGCVSRSTGSCVAGGCDDGVAGEVIPAKGNEVDVRSPASCTDSNAHNFTIAGEGPGNACRRGRE